MKKAIGFLIILIILAGLVYLGIEAYNTLTSSKNPEPTFNFNTNTNTTPSSLINLNVNEDMEDEEADTEEDEEADSEEDEEADAEEDENTIEDEDVDMDDEEEEDTADLPETEENETIVYLAKKGETDCSKVYPVTREMNEEYLEKYEHEEIVTILSLIAPLSSEEREAGYTSAIPGGTRLRYIDMRGSTTKIYLNEVYEDVDDACDKKTRDAQLKKTLTAFDGVSGGEVIIGYPDDEEEGEDSEE